MNVSHHVVISLLALIIDCRTLVTAAESGATRGTLLLHPDMACAISIDGARPLNSKANGAVAVVVSLGQHLIQVVSADNAVQWERTINVVDSKQIVISINLMEIASRQEALTAQKEAALRSQQEEVKSLQLRLNYFVGNWSFSADTKFSWYSDHCWADQHDYGTLELGNLDTSTGSVQGTLKRHTGVKVDRHSSTDDEQCNLKSGGDTVGWYDYDEVWSVSLFCPKGPRVYGDNCAIRGARTACSGDCKEIWNKDVAVVRSFSDPEPGYFYANSAHNFTAYDSASRWPGSMKFVRN